MPAWHKITGQNNVKTAKRKDGTEFPVEISLVPLMTETGSFITVTLQDISIRTEMERIKDQHLESEKKSNQIKDDFLAVLSHELRTPLTTILSWAQLLRMGKLDADKTKRGLEVLEQSAKVQGQLIDDLLDISRIQAGKLNLTLHDVDLNKIVASAIDSTQSLAASKSIQIVTEPDAAVSSFLADPIRLQQILWNLITNSIKFSNKHGRIEIKVAAVAFPSGQQIQIQVSDNGKGIKPDFLSQIFERFKQVENGNTRAYGGLGLGLSIVKNLVEMHDGTITVESPGEGNGTRFTVLFPLKSAAKSEVLITEEKSVDIDLQDLRVLVVEDQKETREVLSVILQSFGTNVKTAGSAREALEIFEVFRPDVLVSDISMPTEDGYSLITKIRALKSTLSKTPALALTAFAGQEDIQRSYLAGFQAHLAKPVDANQLAEAIARLATVRPQVALNL